MTGSIVMNWIDLGFLSVFVSALLVVGFYYIRYRLRVRRVIKAANTIRETHFEQILEAIENIGTCSSGAALLYENGVTNDEKYLITIPSKLDSPWAGRTIRIIEAEQKDVDVKVEFILTDSEVQQLGHTVYKSLRVPRIKTKNGKEQYVWAYSRYLTMSPLLKQLFKGIETADFKEMALANVIRGKINILGGLSWIQNVEFPNCPECKKRMKFLFQFWGGLLPKSYQFDRTEAEVYVFSCYQHQDTLIPVIQFS